MVSNTLDQLDLLETQKVLSQPPASIKDDRNLVDRWIDLALKTQTARISRNPMESNSELVVAAESDMVAPVAPAYLLWAADNQSKHGDWATALKSYDAVRECASKADALMPGMNIGRVAAECQADVFAAMGDVDEAISAWHQLWTSGSGNPDDAEAMLLAGILAEKHHKEDDAVDCYTKIAAKDLSHEYSCYQLALRANMRMEKPGHIERSPAAMRNTLSDALLDRDAAVMDTIVSKTHFLVGVAGGHFRFEDDEFRQRFLAELCELGGTGSDRLVGTGDKRYMFKDGWDGELLCGTAGLVLMRTPKGWECTGVVLSQVCDELKERWKPHEIQKNQPLPFTLRAPWPSGDSFMAGGLEDFVVRSAAVAAAGIGGPLLAGTFSLSDCGYGTRGFYYNDISDTHQDESAFAIDFTRYRRGVPFDNESGGTAVLASAPGIVMTARGGRSSGDSNMSNTVEIDHADPVSGVQNRYRSRYLHLAGPDLLSVSVGMPVITGQRLGMMNDTGNSVLDHLHFSIHDQTEPSRHPTLGMSVRPTPMDGAILDDSGSGTCVASSNRERRPPPLDDAVFVSQSVPRTLKPLESASASFTFRNSGPTTWTRGYRLMSLALGWTLDQRVIGRAVPPGGTITVELPLVSLVPGSFSVQWQLARQFTGRFGQASQRVSVEVQNESDGDQCATLEQALERSKLELESLQDLLEILTGNQKGKIVNRIRQKQGEIAGIQTQMSNANC